MKQGVNSFKRAPRHKLMEEQTSNPPLQENPAPANPSAAPSPPPKRKFFHRPWVIITGTILLGLSCFYGGRFLIHSRTHESTDDAFLAADAPTLAPRVSGQVIALHVTDNQKVRRGELLFEIDPRDYQAVADQRRAALLAAETSLESAKANLALARTRVDTARSMLAQRKAEVAATEASARRANADLTRNRELLENKTISPSEFDAFRAAANADTANLQAARDQAATAESTVKEAEHQLASAQADVSGYEARIKQATADVEAAELNLSYTKVYSPIDGRVTHRTVNKGDYLQVGQNVMAIVPYAVYVVANFKETQLTHMHPGQPATIRVDAYHGDRFSGHVDSIQSGSGANFSLLPPENATGNFVKVVQRVPVKIVFDNVPDGSHVFGPGLSVVPTVSVGNVNLPNWLLLLCAVIIALLVGTWWYHRAETTSAQPA